MSDEDKKPEKDLTPADSPSEEEDQDNNLEDEGDKETPPAPDSKPLSEEEKAWSALSGKSQDRFRKVIQENAQLKEKLTGQVRDDANRVPDNPPPADDEVKAAVNRLRKEGVATVDDVWAIVGDLRRQQQHEKLTGKYSGSEDLPKYDPVEVEDYARRNGFGGNFEAAYRDMYWDEIVDHAKREKRKPQSPVSAKPTSAAKEEPMTLGKLRELLKDPNNYNKIVAKDPQAFDKLLSQLTEAEA